MGNTPSAPVVAAVKPAPAAAPSTAGAGVPTPTVASECPVSEETRQRYLGRMWGGKKAPAAAAPAATADGSLDPTNNMPAVPLQGAAPGQAAPLDTTRVPSTIPKGDASSAAAATWEYPSPQMFWNAMVRKNKTGGASEQDMDVVVAIHNNMNETTWEDVLAWEALASAQEGAPVKPPKLLRFTGRPHDTSPKALLKSTLLGCPLPFDRHDWVVLRPDGEEVRYVIDYYHDDGGVDADGAPALHDRASVQSIRIDVRPALDTPAALFARAVRMPFATTLALGLPTNAFRYLPLAEPRTRPGASQYGPGASSSGSSSGGSVGEWLSKVAAGAAALSANGKRAETLDGGRPVPNAGTRRAAAQARAAEARAEQLHQSRGHFGGGPAVVGLPAELQAVGLRLASACSGCKARVNECGSEAECASAEMALTYCTAQIVCEKAAADFGAGLAGSASEAELELLYSRMAECIGAFETSARLAVQHAGELQK